MVFQRVSKDQRGHGLHEGSGNSIAAQLPQVIHARRVAVGIDESGEQNLIFAVDVLGACGVGADDGSVNDDSAGRKNAVAVEDADVVERDLARGCPWVVTSCVVRYDRVGWIERSKVMDAGPSCL